MSVPDTAAGICSEHGPWWDTKSPSGGCPECGKQSVPVSPPDTTQLAEARESANLAYGYFVALVNHGGETAAAAKKGRDHLKVALDAIAVLVSGEGTPQDTGEYEGFDLAWLADGETVHSAGDGTGAAIVTRVDGTTFRVETGSPYRRPAGVALRETDTR